MSAKAGDGSKLARYSWVATALADEMLDEMSSVDDSAFASYMLWFAKVMQWCATGDMNVLPSGVRDFVIAQAPEYAQLAIEASDSDRTIS